MHAPIVFIPQEPRKHLDDGSWQPLHDLTPALKFGILNVLLPHGPTSLYTDETIRILYEKLINIREDDYILLIGDPTAIAATVMVASEIAGGKLNFLKYDRLAKQYNVVKFSI